MALVAKDDSYIEVHKYRSGTVFLVALLALFLQAFLPKYIPYAAVLELPLLVTIYFSLGRRNPSSGLLLGAAIGLVQDAISHLPLGVYGIALTVVGYSATWIGYRLDVEHPLGRFGLTFLLYGLEQLIAEGIRRFLLQQPVPVFHRYWLLGALLSAALAVLVFPQLDRLRKS
jgi:rod shape-determining protein MreD